MLQLIEDMDRSTFIEDKRTHLAILYEITIVGEIVKRLSPLFRQNYPEIPWKQIAGMRDKLVHDYDKVDLDLTWEVTQSSIPRLLKFVEPFIPPQEMAD
ncbi:HepT-like ribonuclease domain-containing protein [Spirulina sp. CCNP1310]|uniref:HepT-like ribonuclease domain-containing protein n=1 Tax=Spirulina sp. CCNP1310 TaxID=3110249 RepID=UPI002B21F1E8|nr:HepT-like ribonuclease domain-containing protein [Spirulina sp. CCNP1310]MEA5421288.1 HepT-like ribonuclease domain-containing protein [Spirulina sp. CCNP1310]